MAINFSKNYTFSSNTTAASAEVNSNFDQIASTIQGIEAGTTTLAKLTMDANPSAALEVAVKQYVDYYANYRRPRLTYVSATQVDVENNTGTANQTSILFPDGNLRSVTENTSSTHVYRRFDITATASLTATYDSGMRATESEATNTWYAIYAVKTTDSASYFVLVGTVTLPLQANKSTLDGYFGANGYVYLGLIRNGDYASATGDIVAFNQSGNMTLFRNAAAGTLTGPGTLLAQSTATATEWTYAAGTGAQQVPGNISNGIIRVYTGNNSGIWSVCTQALATMFVYRSSSGASIPGMVSCLMPITLGARVESDNSTAKDVFLSGYIDNVLGVGSNPFL